jgi:signal transduction histidine kinase
VLETIVDEHIDQGHRVSLTGLVSAPVLGRVLSLKRAFSNIIGNAIKYGETASVTISNVDDHLVIDVEDEGPGIPQPDMKRVFHPFVRLEESRARETGGTGLGLTIAASVIQNHGGHISLANRATGGLRVTITLSKAEQIKARPSNFPSGQSASGADSERHVA